MKFKVMLHGDPLQQSARRRPANPDDGQEMSTVQAAATSAATGHCE
jgi:hypothetical protein